MTGEEMERAIEFLLNSHASLEAQVEATSRQIAETNKRLDSFGETQAHILQVVSQQFEEQRQVNAEFRRNFATLSHILEEQNRIHAEQSRINYETIADREKAWAAINALSARQDRTEQSVDRLAEAVRRHIEGGGRNNGGG